VSTPHTLTVAEVAEHYLRTTPEAVRNREKRGTLPILPVQRKPTLLYPRDAWDCWKDGKPIPTRHAAGRD
jgi:hypothetical protein